MQAESRDWYPDSNTMVIMNVVGLVLMVAALILFGSAYAAAHGDASVSLSGFGLLAGLAVTLVLTFGLMVIHEGVHGLVIRRYGAMPTFGAAMMGKVMPVFYCTAPDARFTRRQFMVIAMAPSVVVSLACVALITLAPFGGWLVVPAAIHLAGCIGDFVMTVIVARLSPGTRVEDLKTGMRFHAPASREHPAASAA